MASILIIEDDISYRRSMELILRMEGYEVCSANSGSAGLAMVHSKCPDLILCDIMMPELDGHSVLELLSNDRTIKAIPFIFVTALGDRSNVRRGMHEGADDYLSKPFTPEELLSAISGRLQRIPKFQRSGGDEDGLREKIAILKKQTTPRERQVLILVGEGYTSKIIAQRLGICINTVDVHRSNLMRKLDTTNAASLAQWATLASTLSEPSLS